MAPIFEIWNCHHRKRTQILRRNVIKKEARGFLQPRYDMDIKVKKWFLIIGLVSFVFGCKWDSSNDGPSGNQKMIDLVKEQKTIWEESKIISYMFTYHISPSDCPTIDSGFPVIITVENGEVSSVFLTGSGTFSDSTENFQTIDSVFDSMIERLKENPIVFSKSPREKELEPEYDSRYGFPTQYHYDQSSEDCDAWTVSIRDFQ